MNCTYCGSDLSAYEPIYVDETVDGDRVSAGAFCNYACLEAHIDETDRTDGAACAWSPDD